MADQIGASLAALDDLSSGMSDMAEQTGADTEATRKLIEGVQDDVEGISSAMETAFTDLAQNVRDRASNTQQLLQGTEWTGSSQERMVQYETEVNTAVNNFMTSSSEGVAQFKTSLMNFITEFYGVIQGEYTTAMTEIQGKYTDAQTAATTMRQNLADVDANSIKLG